MDPPPKPPCELPYCDFIATRLLPCGQIDAPIEKFTKNDDDVSPSPHLKEHLTVSLHAFSHYVFVWSHSNLLFCDLQGLAYYWVYCLHCCGLTFGIRHVR